MEGERLALEGGLWSVKPGQLLPHTFPHWQRVSHWDFMKGALEGVQNKKGIGKKEEESLEVKGRGHQEFPRVQKRQEIGEKEGVRPTCVEKHLFASHRLS